MSRGNVYTKLIYRFYEVLILLFILGQTRRLRDVNPGPASTPEEARRRLLRNLSYLCDYEKGGKTTTAIAVQENDEGFIFWVAFNCIDPNNKVTSFLRNVLVEVKRVIHTPSDQRILLEDRFIRSCIEFARSRIHKEIKMLRRSIQDCERRLDLENNSKGWFFDNLRKVVDSFTILLKTTRYCTMGLVTTIP